MKTEDFQEGIQKAELYQQIKLLATATFENYNVKQIEALKINESEIPENLSLLKLWYTTTDFLSVKVIGGKSSALDAEMIILAMDFCSVLGLEGIKLQVNETEHSLLKEYLELAAFEYDVLKLENLNFKISLLVGGETMEICRSSQHGFDFKLGKLRIALEEQDINLLEPVRLHAYLTVLSERADFEASRLLLSLRHQGYSVDRNYQIREFENQNDFLGNSSADLLIVLGEKELECQRLTVKNLETMKSCDYSLSEIYSDFSSVYEEVVMSF